GWYEKAVAVLERETRQASPQPQSREFLVKSFAGMAHTLVHLGRCGDAAAVLTRGLALQPGLERPRFLVLRGYARAREGDYAGAGAGGAAGPAEPDALARMIYAAARPFALSAAGARDADLAERHARRALELLDRAKAARYFRDESGRQRLRTDKDLEVLQAREDFLAFVKGVEGEASDPRP